MIVRVLYLAGSNSPPVTAHSKYILQRTALLHMPPWRLRGSQACYITYISTRAASHHNNFCQFRSHARCRPSTQTGLRWAQSAPYTAQSTGATPLRKQLKDEAKQRRAAARNATPAPSTESQRKLKDWELTVGIEIHAQLNTARKLFSCKYSVHVARSKLINSRCGNFHQ